jgi:integrase
VPRPNTGEILERSGSFYLRIKLAGDRRTMRLAASTRPEAEERRAVLASMRADLEGQPAQLVVTFLEKAAGADANGLRDALRLAAGLRSGKVRAASPTSSTGPAEPTVKSVATDWFNGTLGARFPDYVRRKKTHANDAGRFELYVFPLVGDVPIKAFSLEHAESVMAAIPPTRTPATRRHVAQLLHRLLGMALFPLRLRADNPIPKGFLPRVGSAKGKVFPYPAEIAKLLACKAVPLPMRVLYGVLAAEGMRASEALRLTWGSIDAVRGVLRLETNKTGDHGRAWALSPGVAPALAAWRELQRDHGVNVSDAARVFVAEDGSELAPHNGAEHFRAHLLAAGVDRAELHTRTAYRLPVRQHDLRAAFVTLALAAGRSEAWVTDRTGHRSSAQIYTYKRAARLLHELDLGTLAPLDTAIPELAATVESPPESPPGPDSTHPAEPESPNDSKAFDLVPRDGIEPPTRGFSILCSTN